MTPTPSEPQRKNEQIAKQVIQTAYESIQETDVIISITERGLEEAIKSALDTLEREKDVELKRIQRIYLADEEALQTLIAQAEKQDEFMRGEVYRLEGQIAQKDEEIEQRLKDNISQKRIREEIINNQRFKIQELEPLIAKQSEEIQRLTIAGVEAVIESRNNYCPCCHCRLDEIGGPCKWCKDKDNHLDTERSMYKAWRKRCEEIEATVAEKDTLIAKQSAEIEVLKKRLAGEVGS